MVATFEVHMAIDCVNADTQLEFWAAALGYVPHGRAGQYRSLLPAKGTSGPKIILQETGQPKPSGKNRLHLDLVVGDALDDEAGRLVALGATRLTDGTIDEAGTSWIVMADPEGNEFCLVAR